MGKTSSAQRLCCPLLLAVPSGKMAPRTQKLINRPITPFFFPSPAPDANTPPSPQPRAPPVSLIAENLGLPRPMFNEPCREPMFNEHCREPMFNEHCREPMFNEHCREPMFNEHCREPKFIEHCREPRFNEHCREPKFNEH